MFYSQFILAKKGPLGTIWIAAHLERKLKKNQVADTDIGVSVDSILFPEVPIALRLSSHLLLGVVRIYSRKVNYLFHDCSEALLKVKQAFRSTAVDLPPEESTAPYHSITLPETFDLDDFELPDSALISGNFDDRHVSTREQITLQDTLDGTGYSTSQFGLDERFGDGDASQIGLDLDEELLLDNNLTLQDASVLDGAVHQGEGHTKMDIDEGQHGHDEDQNDDASRELSDLLSNNRGKHVVSNAENVNRHDDSSHRLLFNIQTPDLNEVFLPNDLIGGPSAPRDIEMDFAAADPPSPEFNESANFPSMPRLFLEEAIQANSHELPASSLHKNSPSTAVEAVDKTIDQEVECPDAINAASTSPKTANLAQVVSSPTSVLAEPKPDSVEAGPDAATNCNLTPVEPTDPNLADNSQVLRSSTSAPQCPGEIMTTPVTCGEANAQPVSLDNSLISGMASGIDGFTLADTARLSNLDQGRAEDAHSCQTSNVNALSSDLLLRSCTAAGNQANLISPEDMVQERAEGLSFREQPCNLETPMVDQEFNFIGSSADLQGFRSAIATDANLMGDQKSKHVQAGHGNCFSSSEFSEPERTRFAPFGNVNLLNDLGQQTSCQTSNDTALSSDFLLRSCTAAGNQANLISPEDMVQERVEGFSFREQPCNLETPLVDREFNFIGSSADLQGFRPVIATDANSVGDQKSNHVQAGHGNCFSSSEFSERERMQFAPFGNVNLLNDLGQQTSCQTSNVTALSSDFLLRSSTAAGNQANLISPEDMVQERAEGFSFREQPCNLEAQDFLLRSSTAAGNQANLISPDDMVQERAEGFSFVEQPCNLETPLVDREFNFIGSSADLQGFRSAIATDANLVGDQKSNHVQAGHGNCFLSSEFSEPERMRFVPFGNVNLLNDLGQQTTEKGFIESDGSFDRISTLSGHKRHLIDSTLDLQNGISPKMSGIPRKKRNNDYIPNDDDLLASILVGRTPALRVGPTPPLPKPPLIKRPRITNKVGLPKRRKVLLDDKIVLNADAIRQQLINTEDIRRIRKKVPCTRSEIWRIQKSSLEDDIFCESIFTGISEELNSFLTRRYAMAQNVHSQINGQHSSGEAAKGLKLSTSSILVRENDGKEMAEQGAVVPKRIDVEMQGPSGILELIEAESTDAQERLESSHDPHHMDLPGNTISRGDLDADICANPEQNKLNNSHELAEINNNIVHVAANNETSLQGEDFSNAKDASIRGEDMGVDIVNVAANNETSLQGEDFSNAKDASIPVEDMGVDIVNVANLDCPRDASVNIGKDENGGTAVSVLNRFIVEDGADFPVDSSTVIGYANSSVPDMGLVDGGPVNSEYQAMQDSEEGRVTAGYETVVDEERPDSEFPCEERPHRTESEQVPSAVGENSCMNRESGLDVESTPVGLAATKEPSDFCSAIDDIDTDFLNVDDEVEYDDETNDDVPNTEEAQSLENSGWSSRTRGVARYLKNMFDQESGRGRKSVAIDQLLAGKTRKEASRMFFETLVLKTKDYIHVEQENPFNLVNIKPRIKLLKSEF